MVTSLLVKYILVSTHQK